MNPSNDPDLKQKLEQLEAEVYLPQRMPFSPPTFNDEPSAMNQFSFSHVQHWFFGLSQAGKVIVVAIAAVFAMAAMSLILKLISALIGLALLGLILVGVYQFFLKPSMPKD